MTVIMPMEIIGAGFGQAQKCGGVKLIKWIPFVLFLIITIFNMIISIVDCICLNQHFYSLYNHFWQVKIKTSLLQKKSRHLLCMYLNKECKGLLSILI
jgi:hypothetical protein